MPDTSKYQILHDAPLPPGRLDPGRIYEGVRLGVEHGGNKAGIPTVNGSLTFHERFLGKPLVFCGTGGLLPAEIANRPGHEKWVHPGDRIVMVGGRIGADGIHGATFASEELSEDSLASRPQVQVGDPFTEKLLLEASLELIRSGHITGIQDMGAAAITSSASEMAGRSGNGVEIDMDRVPVREAGMTPYEILLSESQERMLVVAKAGRVDDVPAILNNWELEAEEIGRVTDDALCRVMLDGRAGA